MDDQQFMMGEDNYSWRYQVFSNILRSREIDTPDRHELILLGDGEKKVTMAIETRE